MTALFILILVATVFAALVVAAQNTAKIKKAEREAFVAQHEGWDIYVSPQDKSLLGLHHDNKEIMVGAVGASRVFPWSEIAAVEVIKNGHAITSTNRTSQFGGAALGGLAFGPVGMIIGGLSGKSKTQEKITEIKIKILIDDRVAPVHYVTFFSLSTGIRPDSALLKRFTERLDHFHALVVNAIRSQSKPKQEPPLLGANNLDEIEKLWKLKEIGAITDEEFSAQKSTLLNVRIPAASPPDASAIS